MQIRKPISCISYISEFFLPSLGFIKNDKKSQKCNQISGNPFFQINYVRFMQNFGIFHN